MVGPKLNVRVNSDDSEVEGENYLFSVEMKHAFTDNHVFEGLSDCNKKQRQKVDNIIIKSLKTGDYRVVDRDSSIYGGESVRSSLPSDIDVVVDSLEIEGGHMVAHVGVYSKSLPQIPLSYNNIFELGEEEFIDERGSSLTDLGGIVASHYMPLDWNPDEYDGTEYPDKEIQKHKFAY